MRSKEINAKSTIRLLFIAAVAAVVLLLAYYTVPSHPYGDAAEYILMTESMYNHGTPELRGDDVTNYINAVEAYRGSVVHIEKFRSLEELGNTTFRIFNTGWYGYFTAKNNELYCFHFWFYSALCVPFRFLLDVLGGDITKTFILSNALIMFLTLLGILRMRTFSHAQKGITSVIYLLSPVFWYLAWPHPEVLAGSLVFLSVLLIVDHRPFFALLLMSLASMHFQPLFIPALIIAIHIFIIHWKSKNWINLKFVLKLSACAIWVLLPAFFYMYHYNIPNLIVDKGFISTSHISFRRLFSFFFDLNQGMVVGIPIALLGTLYFVIRDIFKRNLDLLFVLVVSVLPMSLFFMQMGNWNHGMVIVNRYVVWTSSIVVVFCISRLLEYRKPIANILLGSIALGQMILTFSYIDYTNIYWGDSSKHYRLATFVLDNYPSFYNPEPIIFQQRNNPVSLSTTDSVIVYNRRDSTITKMMLRQKGGIDQLILRGISTEKVDSLKKELKFYKGWVYMNKSDLEKLGYVQTEDTFIMYSQRLLIQELEREIRLSMENNAVWMNQLEQKSIDYKIDLEEVMQQDIDYLIEQELQKAYAGSQ